MASQMPCRRRQSEFIGIYTDMGRIDFATWFIMKSDFDEKVLQSSPFLDDIAKWHREWCVTIIKWSSGFNYLVFGARPALFAKKSSTWCWNQTSYGISGDMIGRDYDENLAIKMNIRFEPEMWAAFVKAYLIKCKHDTINRATLIGRLRYDRRRTRIVTLEWYFDATCSIIMMRIYQNIASADISSVQEATWY